MALEKGAAVNVFGGDKTDPKRGEIIDVMSDENQTRYKVRLESGEEGWYKSDDVMAPDAKSGKHRWRSVRGI
jgi:hypothetical protein